MPHFFKDVDGSEWEIIISIGKVAQIESLLGVNLGCPEFPAGNSMPLLTRLAADVALVSRLIWLSGCSSCATARQHSVKEEYFYEDILVGETFREAWCAWLKEYQDFIRRRSFGDIDRQTNFERAIKGILDRLNSGKSSGNGLASAASPIPAT